MPYAFLPETFVRAILFSSLVMGCITLAAEEPAQSEAGRPPNIVIIFTDDQGYEDIGCFGSPDIETPHLDRMAAEGRRFTHFYVAQAVCSASRAGLLTGCHSHRVGITGALGPGSRIGIHEDEMLLSEVCKKRGYATALFGKWHLGDRPRFLPTRHGFDEYFGLPYSNDMWPYHPTNKTFPPLPLIEGEELARIVTPEDQEQLTTWLTERAVDFIERHHHEPFFLYVPHPMPHVPLFVSEKFRGKSARGLYGDVIMEIDWSVGQILAAVRRLGIDDNTLVIYTSDNGPWLSYGDHGGSALPLREGKGTAWEGGQRVPCIMRWPGQIPAGTTCDQLASTIDILPTVARLIDVELCESRPLDGRDIWPLMSEEGAKTPHEYFPYFYNGHELHAVRSGDWKLYFPHAYRSLDGSPGGTGGRPAAYVQKRAGLELYNLKDDLGETRDLAASHPEIVARLQAYAEYTRAELGDKLTGQRGSGVREPGRATD